MRLGALGVLCAAVAASDVARNVIHIVVDDLRPEIGAYGLPGRSTPNMDKLAEGGMVFDRAFCQQAVCGPSRNSFMSGRRPDRSRSWNFINHFREDHPEWTSLPGMFKQAGRLALGAGKLYHPKLPPAYDGNNSWSSAALPFRNPCWNTADDTKIKFEDGGLPCVPCPVDVSHYLFKTNTSIANEFCQIDAFEDSLTIDSAITQLRRAAREGAKGFYLGVGLHKPHMPWQAAPEDFAKHPIDDISPAKYKQPPKDVPGLALQMTDGATHPDPFHSVSDSTARTARRAYRAATTGMDRKLGRLLNELETLGLENETAIVLHGDHGWQLGELGEWRKFTNFEIATRVPLIIRAPWLASAKNARSDALVELVDVMPTIADLAGVSPPGVGETPLDGVSLVPILAGTAPNGTVKSAAFSQYPRRVKNQETPWDSNSIIHRNRSSFTHMGYSVRTRGWRYTEWVAWDGVNLSPVWTDVAGRELYDHRNQSSFPTDFDSPCETVNVAKANPDVVKQLSAIIRSAFG